MAITPTNIQISWGNYENAGVTTTDKNGNSVTAYTPNCLSITFVNYINTTSNPDTITYYYQFTTTPTIYSDTLDTSKFSTTETTLTIPTGINLNGSITVR